MIRNLLGNRFGLYPTIRLMDGLKIYTFLIVLGILAFFGLPNYKKYAEPQVLETFKIKPLDVEQYQVYTVCLILSIIAIIVIRWSIRNRLSFKN